MATDQIYIFSRFRAKPRQQESVRVLFTAEAVLHLAAGKLMAP